MTNSRLDNAAVTPEIHQRAAQFIANRILLDACSMGRAGKEMNKIREDFGLEPDPTAVVQELSAQMGVQVAQMIASGELVLMTKKPEGKP